MEERSKMPAKSENQRKLFGAALAYKRGESPDASDKVKEIANSMSEDKLEEFAKKASSDNEFVRFVTAFKEAKDKKKKSPAWTRKKGQNREGGLNEAGRKSYERENPGSNLKAPVTGKVKKGGAASKRRKSFCARSDGQRKMHNIDCSKTPDKRICKARRKWKCASQMPTINVSAFISGYTSN